MPPCSDYSSLAQILIEAPNKINAIVCAFTSDMGTGMGMAVFMLLFIGPLGLAFSARVQHPGPILVVGIFSAGLIATSLPGIMAKLFALVLFFGIAAVGLIIYQRAQNTL